MDLHGPIQVDRAKRTRAQFLKMLVSKVKDPQGPIEFYSAELNEVEPIAGGVAQAGGSGGVGSKAGKGVGTVWQVPASAEDDPPGASASYGPLPASRREASSILLAHRALVGWRGRRCRHRAHRPPAGPRARS